MEQQQKLVKPSEHAQTASDLDSKWYLVLRHMRHMRHLVAFEGLKKSIQPSVGSIHLRWPNAKNPGVYGIRWCNPPALLHHVRCCLDDPPLFHAESTAGTYNLCWCPSWDCGVGLKNRARIQVFMRTALPGPRIPKLSSNDFKHF